MNELVRIQIFYETIFYANPCLSGLSMPWNSPESTQIMLNPEDPERRDGLLLGYVDWVSLIKTRSGWPWI